MSRSRLEVARAGAALALLVALAAPASGQSAGASGPSGSAPPPEPGGAVPVPEDLFAVITLRGKPCGAVKRYERLGDADYRVVCADGHRYRVRVTSDRRVVVEEE